MKRFGLAMLLCFAILIPLIKTSTTIPQILRKRKSHLHRRVINLKDERHRTNKFTFVTLNTEITSSWDVIPLLNTVDLSHLLGDEPCPVSLQIKLINFGKGKERIVCVFRDSLPNDIVEPKADITIMDATYDLKSLNDGVYPVTGFIVNEENSVVKGYIVDKYFYGSIRVFDKLRKYHLHFYVEPIENLVLYSIKYLQEKVERRQGDNAILFEYISHEDYYENVKPVTTPTTPSSTSETSTVSPSSTLSSVTSGSGSTDTPTTASTLSTVATASSASTMSTISTSQVPSTASISPSTTAKTSPSTALTTASSTPTTPTTAITTPSTPSTTASTTPSSTPTTANTTPSTPSTTASTTSTTVTTPSTTASTTSTTPSTTASTTSTTPSTTASTTSTTPSTTASTTSTTPSTTASTTSTTPSTTASTTSTTPSTTASTTPSTTPTTESSTASTPSTADTTASTADTTASTADTTASTADTTASTAETTASTAQTTPSTADTTASAAETTASTADTTASTADTTASTADTTASTADTTASTADTTASTADTTASTADTTASTADTTPSTTSESTTTASTTTTPTSTTTLEVLLHSTEPTPRSGSRQTIVNSGSSLSAPSLLTPLTPASSVTSPSTVPTTAVSTPSTLPTNAVTTPSTLPTTAVTNPSSPTTTELSTPTPSTSVPSTASTPATTPSTTSVSTSPSTSTVSSAEIPFHSTEPTPRMRGRRSLRKRQKRTVSFPTLNTSTTLATATIPGASSTTRKIIAVRTLEDSIKFQDDDFVKVVKLKTGLSTSDLFDLRKDQSLICSLCIWIQPNFADKFGFNSGMAQGVAEIIEIIKLANWWFRAFDFNSDGLAENVGFQIKNILVSDEIKVSPTQKQETVSQSSLFYPLMQKSIRKKRSILSETDTHWSFNLVNYDIDPKLFLEMDNFGYMNEIDNRPQERLLLKTPKSEETKSFSKMIYSLSVKQAYEDISSGLKNNPRFSSGCCAILGFLYHNLSPSLSISNIRGICSESNIALIPGVAHMHKVGKFDILRSVMHALGHLFGGHHDKTLNSNCKDAQFSYFINPFLLDPFPQMNIGLRPNSMKMSPCAKIDIAVFISSPSPSCLQVVDQSSFCGNGWVDPGEDCDCGSPWQCQLDSLNQCCGESDSAFRCKRVDSADLKIIQKKKCSRPLKW